MQESRENEGEALPGMAMSTLSGSEAVPTRNPQTMAPAAMPASIAEVPSKLAPIGNVALSNTASFKPRAREVDESSLTTLDEENQMDLQEIKARTMFRMVEDIKVEGEKKRLLFLTNKQAALLATSTASMAKVLEAFEVPKPKLVINLLKSLGTQQWYEGISNAGANGAKPDGSLIIKGIVKNALPWLDDKEMMDGYGRLVTFMKDVIIPLAAETNAVILGCCNQGECFLTQAFLDALSVERAKWGGKLPFSFLGLGAEMKNLYLYKSENAHWRQVRRASHHWRSRDKLILDIVENDPIKPVAFDLDSFCTNVIICDSVDERKLKIDQKNEFVNFSTELLRYLSSTLPSITIKTGHSVYNPMGAVIVPSSAELAMMSAKAGSPVLFLDLRARKPTEAADRQEFIDQAKEAWMDHNSQMLSLPVPRCDNFDVCGMAYLHQVLFSDPSGGIDRGKNNTEHEENKIALHYALRQIELGDHVEKQGGWMKRATPEQVQETVAWFTNWLIDSYWQLVPPEMQQDPSVRKLYWGDILYKIRLVTSSLIDEETFHGCNVGDLQGARSLVRELVKLDRLPKFEKKEGLLLLRFAWNEYDVAMNLAAHYKLMSKITYLVLLVLGVAVVTCTVLQVQALQSSPGAPSDAVCSLFADGKLSQDTMGAYVDLSACPGVALDSPEASSAVSTALSSQLSQSIFLLSVISSLLLSVIGFINPSARWRQLRASALALESIIFQFRTRVGPFVVSNMDPSSQYTAFSQALQTWREELVSGSDLQVSVLERKHKAKVYKHHQNSGPDVIHGTDDFHSPVKPETYIAIRLLPAMEFYQARIPTRVRWRNLMQFLVFLSSGVSAVLTYFGFPAYVAIISSVGSAITSWQEFTDTGRKIERYTSAVRSIKNLHTWWSSLGEVDKASTESVTMLIMTGEAIITNEHRAWKSTATLKGDNDKKKKDEEASGQTKRAEDKQNQD